MNGTSEKTESPSPAGIMTTLPAAVSVPMTAMVAWLIPGLGHFLLGFRKRAIILFVTTTITFWTGIAVGGVKSTVSFERNTAWFLAQSLAGVQSMAAWGAGSYVAHNHPGDVRYEAYWPSDNVAVIYTGVCGLLNLLIVIDAIVRCDTMCSKRDQRGPPRRGAAV